MRVDDFAQVRDHMETVLDMRDLLCLHVRDKTGVRASVALVVGTVSSWTSA